MSELAQFVSAIPPVTRTITLTSLAMCALNALNVVPYVAFVWYWPAVWNEWQFYRIFTGLLVPHPQPMQGLTEIYMVYSFSRGLEEGKFSRILPDYIYYHLIILPIIVLATFFTAPPLISSTPSLLSALTYTWCVANYDQTVNFYFMQIKASLLPAVFLGFRLLVDGRASFFQALIGMCAAYIYNCIETASLGPLMSVITGQQMLEPPHRVGTTTTTTTHNVWYYSQGYLPAPVWLRTAISKLTGIDYNSRIFQRPYGMMFQAKQPAKSAATQTSFLRRMSNNAFQGRGQRLGSAKE